MKIGQSIIIAFILILMGILGLVWTKDLQQVNKETIFLTQDGRTIYEKFQEDFNVSSVIVMAFNKNDAFLIRPILDQKCQDLCQVVDKSTLKINEQDFKLENEFQEAVIIIQDANQSEDEFKAILRSLLIDFKDYEVLYSGVTFINILLDQYSHKVKQFIFPALFCGVLLLLLMILRSIKFAIVVFTPSLLASSLSLVFTKLMFHQANLITSIIPLLLFIVQMSLVLHIHYTALELKNLKASLKDKVEPVVLMVVTTFIGFGSLYFSELSAISQFGFLTATLLLLSTLLTYVWLYNLANLAPHWWEKKLAHDKSMNRLKSFLERSWTKKQIMTFSLLSVLGGLIALPQLKIITDSSEYFPKSEKIKENMIYLSENFVGTPILDIVIKKENLNHQDLLKIQELEYSLFKEIPRGAWLSSNRLIQLANKQYTGNESIPLASIAYLTLRSQIPNFFISGYPIESSYRISLFGSPMNVDDYEAMILKISDVFRDHGLSSNQYYFNGIYYQLMLAQKTMITTLFKSFFTSLMLIAFITLAYFRSMKIFTIFLFVNLVPIFASFVFVYLFGLSLNIATVMTYSISLGLIVDSTFHIIHVFNSKTKSNQYVIDSVLMPVFVGSMLLVICFSFFALSDFLPIRQFGLGLALMIFLGMVMDIKFLPSMLRIK